MYTDVLLYYYLAGSIDAAPTVYLRRAIIQYVPGDRVIIILGLFLIFGQTPGCKIMVGTPSASAFKQKYNKIMLERSSSVSRKVIVFLLWWAIGTVTSDEGAVDFALFSSFFIFLNYIVALKVKYMQRKSYLFHAVHTIVY